MYQRVQKRESRVISAVFARLHRHDRDVPSADRSGICSMNRKCVSAGHKGTISRVKVRLSLEACLLLPGGFVSSCASAQGQPDVLRMIAEAKTPADHEAIAEYYDQQTTDAESKARFEEAMAGRYRRIHPRWLTPDHCIKIAEHYERIAQQNSQLAAAHRALAQQGH